MSQHIADASIQCDGSPTTTLELLRRLNAGVRRLTPTGIPAVKATEPEASGVQEDAPASTVAPVLDPTPAPQPR